MTTELSFHEQDYPGLYQAANSESIRTQKIYFTAMRWFLILLILGSIYSLYTVDSKLIAIIAAVLFILSLSLSIFMAYKRHDRTWYSARAVAESVKTLTWRYMMCAEPYLKSMPERDVRNSFLSDLEAILKENRDVTKELCNENASSDAISSMMEKIRASERPQRLSLYTKCRVEEQRNWYKNKSRFNKDCTAKWFFILVSLNGVAILCALLRIGFTSWTFLPTEVFAVAAASSVSWLQAKRFNELSTSYALAAHEITIIMARMHSISTDEDFYKYVSDTENAFSREHTQWTARRDTVVRKK